MSTYPQHGDILKSGHPYYPESNVAKYGGYDPDKYALADVSKTIATHESLKPGCAPHLTQYCIAKYLVPLSKSLTEVPARPTISELPDAVIDHMVTKDKAFWVDKPGLNDYTIHDAYNQYGIFPDVVRPIPQNVFPRSYQYDLDCVRYRRSTACDGLKDTDGKPKKPLSAHCRDCRKLHIPPLTPFQLAWAKDTGQKRWRYYPDLTATLTREEIRASMDNVGRPFQNEACNWYYKNYPPFKYECIVRKFSK
ncbi:hypothetical protein HW555_003802 [Spodoptera exigua]|uniref:Uncharacterized protein n=1 Tax=Spodoptera exigua TaxID=7107 RepID=A0A835GPI8_SPOEX|nr:hypothetical protein HW555_003802 [Spodoptera exigua]KAH9627975.1 hypothetical protein HF086_017950 [Spodoptera exigua]